MGNGELIGVLQCIQDCWLSDSKEHDRGAGLFLFVFICCRLKLFSNFSPAYSPTIRRHLATDRVSNLSYTCMTMHSVLQNVCMLLFLTYL